MLDATHCLCKTGHICLLRSIIISMSKNPAKIALVWLRICLTSRNGNGCTISNNLADIVMSKKDRL